jgi:hypothetical protein
VSQINSREAINHAIKQSSISSKHLGTQAIKQIIQRSMPNAYGEFLMQGSREKFF